MMSFNVKVIKVGRSAVRAISSLSVLTAVCLVLSFVFSTSVLAESVENPCAVINNPRAKNPCSGSTPSEDPAVTTPGTNYYEDFSPKIEYITPDKLKIYIIPDYSTGEGAGGSAPDWTGVVNELGTTRERGKDGDGTGVGIGTEDDDGDDPRDTPPPVIYGEEISDRYGVLLMRDDDKWIPRYGNATTVRARIYIPHPNRINVWVPSKTAKKIITVKFTERSNEPGKALNRNIRLGGPPEDTPDVFLRQDDDIECYDDPEGKGHYGACDTKARVNSHSFVVKSEDFGSYSKMDASCDKCVPLTVLHMGKKLDYWPLAIEEDDPKVRLVRVPKDVNDNQIADGYPPDQGEHMGPDYDDDKKPKGDGTDGDGLGAYEEYRGFYVVNDKKGPHIRTDWHVKDLFIYNPSGLPGVYKFGEVAKKVDVHEVASYGHKKRVINFNYNHGHVVDQHGLILKVDPTTGNGLLGEVTDFGPPRNVELVKIYKGNHVWSKHYTGHLEGTVIHELGHAVGMRHHGDTRTWKETWHPPGGASEIIGGLLKIITWPTQTHSVHNRRVLCGKRLTASISFGHKHNQSSGVETCYMRYKYHGDVFKQEDGTMDCLGRAPDYTEFCDTSEGKAFNAGNRAAGGATKGSCAKQLIINDSE